MDADKFRFSARAACALEVSSPDSVLDSGSMGNRVPALRKSVCLQDKGVKEPWAAEGSEGGQIERS